MMPLLLTTFYISAAHILITLLLTSILVQVTLNYSVLNSILAQVTFMMPRLLTTSILAHVTFDASLIQFCNSVGTCYALL